jgi:hypothetical protein
MASSDKKKCCSCLFTWCTLFTFAGSIVLVAICSIFIAEYLRIHSWSSCYCKNIDKDNPKIVDVGNVLAVDLNATAVCIGRTATTISSNIPCLNGTFITHIRYPPPPYALNVKTAEDVMTWARGLPPETKCYVEQIVMTEGGNYTGYSYLSVVEPTPMDTYILLLVIAGLLLLFSLTVWFYWIKTCCMRCKLKTAHVVTG